VKENEVAKQIVDAAFQIHTALGPGLLESVYEKVLERELKKRGLSVERQRAIPIRYDGLLFDEGFRADIIVEDCVIVDSCFCPVKSTGQKVSVRLCLPRLPC